MKTYRHVNYLWDDSSVAALSGVERLVYRSNRLGSDQRITNTGGGNNVLIQGYAEIEEDPIIMNLESGDPVEHNYT